MWTPGRLFLLLHFLRFTGADNPTCTSPTIWLTIDACQVLPAGRAQVNSWGFVAGVNTVANQICIAPSTVANDTFLMEAAICQGPVNLNVTTSDQCQSRRGNTIDKGQL